MIAPQKIKEKTKAGKATGTGHMSEPAVPAAAKKNVRIKKNIAKVATSIRPNPAERESPVFSETAQANAHIMHTAAITDAQAKKNRIKTASHDLHNNAGMSSHTISEEEQANAHAMHTVAITDAQAKKNRIKTASHYQHNNAGMSSHTISEEEQANAHAMHTVAITDAQVKKNDAKVVSHNLHNHAGMPAHTVSEEDIAAAIKTGSHDAKIAARNPHHPAGITAQKDPGHEKSGIHKTGKSGFVANLREETRKNMDFRRVLYTGKFSQLVLMSLKPGEDIGLEIHEDVDQFFRFEEGQGIVEIDGTSHAVMDGSGVIVPCGATHNVTNTSEIQPLKLYTLYSPPEHQDKVIRKTQREALSDEEHFDGKTTEKYH